MTKLSYFYLRTIVQIVLMEKCLSVQALPEYEGRNITIINPKELVEKRAFLMMRSRWQKVIIFVFMMPRMPCLKRMHFTFS